MSETTPATDTKAPWWQSILDRIRQHEPVKPPPAVMPAPPQIAPPPPSLDPFSPPDERAAAAELDQRAAQFAADHHRERTQQHEFLFGDDSESMNRYLGQRRLDQQDLDLEVSRAGERPAGDLPELERYDRRPGVGHSAQSREENLADVYEMTPEDFDALTPDQQAAVEFNTALFEAAQRDDAAGNDDATRTLINRLGFSDLTNVDVDEFLRLDRFVDDDLLARLVDRDARVEAASAQRWAGGGGEAAPGRNLDLVGQDVRDLRNAQNAAALFGNALERSLGERGVGNLFASPDKTKPGFSPPESMTADDVTIWDVYSMMIDKRYNLSIDEVTAGLAERNALNGSNVTPKQLWNFVDANLSAVEYGRRSGRPEQLRHLPVNPRDNKKLKPLDVDEIRKRYFS